MLVLIKTKKDKEQVSLHTGYEVEISKDQVLAVTATLFDTFFYENKRETGLEIEIDPNFKIIDISNKAKASTKANTKENIVENNVEVNLESFVHKDIELPTEVIEDMVSIIDEEIKENVIEKPKVKKKETDKQE